ncbi:MAG: response regulator [Candidatus Omnitrophota bacterium]|nr:response regulator [Candidatus Omnitrophota bacterium]
MAKPRIVAIDDEAEFIDMIQNYFGLRGYDIAVAIRGTKGIELVKEKKPDVVLMDLKMPGIDGDEVLSLLKSMDPSPKVIFVTAYDDGGKTKARLLKMGAYAYFDKPISSLRDLEEAVNKAAQA